MNPIMRAWSGQERLWKVFWIYGVLFGIIIGIAAAIAGVSQTIPYIVANIIYGLWLVVAEWRCAFNATWKIWGYVVRVLIVLSIIFIVIGFFTGGVLVGSDLIKAAECRREVKEYLANGGTDEEGFKKQCIDRKTGATPEAAVDTAPEAAPAPAATPSAEPSAAIPAPATAPAEAPATAPVDTPAVNLEEHKAACEKSMADHATKNGVDPQQYIAQNQAYLQQCVQHHQSNAAAAGGTN